VRPESRSRFNHKPYQGPFVREGRTQDPRATEKAAERRRQGDALARLLIQGRLADDEVYVAEDGSIDTMVALDGSSYKENLGRARRRWSGYPDHAYATKTALGRDICVFADTHGVGDVIQIVVRSPWHEVGLRHLHDWHGKESPRLADMLRYFRKKKAPSLEWLLVAAEVDKCDDGDGWLLDCHFHLTVVGVTDDELEAMQAYFRKRGWTFWFREEDDEAAGRHPAALVQYSAKGLAHALRNAAEWSPEALAELRRQTRNLAMIRATGRFRRWRGQVAVAKLVAAEDEDGKPELHARPTRCDRPRRLPGAATPAMVLRFLVHDFGDGLLRRAALVRGASSITLEDLQTAYDLRYAIAYKVNTAFPELR
jgi:hypothetical protein